MKDGLHRARERGAQGIGAEAVEQRVELMNRGVRALAVSVRDLGDERERVGGVSHEESDRCARTRLTSAPSVALDRFYGRGSPGGS